MEERRTERAKERTDGIHKERKKERQTDRKNGRQKERQKERKKARTKERAHNKEERRTTKEEGRKKQETCRQRKEDRRKRVIETLRMVKLEPAEEIARKHPHMLSGGQRQRVVIARAIVVKPEIIIADEPVSMLDVSIRAEILELMKEIQKENEISMIYITHDLATAKHFADNIVILNSGKVMEVGPINKVLLNPENSYTKALIAAISEPDPENLHKMKEISL